LTLVSAGFKVDPSFAGRAETTMSRPVSAIAIALVCSVTACDPSNPSDPGAPGDDGGDSDESDDSNEVGCPAGQHDGGDGTCLTGSGCSTGYRPTSYDPVLCAAIEPGTLRYVGPHGPVTGVAVLFHDDTGAVIDRGETDEAGEVLNLLPRVDQPGLVTLIVPDSDLSGPPDGPTLMTERLWPYESHVFRGPRARSEPTASLTVTLPGEVAGAVAYSIDAGAVQTSVADATQPIELVGARSGLTATPAVLALAIDAAGTPLAWTIARDPDGPTITLDPWSQELESVELTLEQIPADVPGFAYLAFEIDGREYAMSERFELEPRGPEQIEPVRVVQRIASLGEVDDQAHVVVGFAAPSPGLYVEPFWPRNDVEETVRIDFSSALPPPVDAMSVEPSPDDPARPVLSWSTPSRRPRWRDVATLEFTGAERTERWSLPVIDTTSITVPALSPDLAVHAPADLDGASLTVHQIDGNPQPGLHSLYGPDGARAWVSRRLRRRTEAPDGRLMMTTTTLQLDERRHRTAGSASR
jgi:hypothetical protein